MSLEEFERDLMNVPVRELPPDARREIMETVSAADARRLFRLRSLRVSLWHAIAACIVVAAISVGATRYVLTVRGRPDASVPQADVPPAEGRQFVSVNAADIGFLRPPVYELNITRWAVRPRR